MAEQFLDLAQRQHDPAHLMRAHCRLSQTLFNLGAFAPSRTHLEQALALFDSRWHATLRIALGRIRDYRTVCLLAVGRALWVLGYPDQAVQRSQEALTMAHALAHPFLLVDTLYGSALLQRYRREWQTVQAHAEAMLALATEHGFARHVALGVLFRGLALAAQGQTSEGIAQMRQGIAGIGPRGQRRPAGTSGPAGGGLWDSGQAEEGLRLLAEALAVRDDMGGRLTKPSCIASRGNCCYARPSRMSLRPRPASSRPWSWPVASKPDRGSCARP